jgi:hypothetical protein
VIAEDAPLSVKRHWEDRLRTALCSSVYC